MATLTDTGDLGASPSERDAGPPSLDLTATTTGNSTSMSVRLAALDKRLRHETDTASGPGSAELRLDDDSESDVGGSGGLKLHFTEGGYDQTASPLGTTGGLATTAAGGRPFNPHITMGGTVHAGITKK